MIKVAEHNIGGKILYASLSATRFGQYQIVGNLFRLIIKYGRTLLSQKQREVSVKRLREIPMIKRLGILLISGLSIIIWNDLCLAALINKSAWRLAYVDSEELVGEDSNCGNAFDGLQYDDLAHSMVVWLARHRRTKSVLTSALSTA